MNVCHQYMMPLSGVMQAQVNIKLEIIEKEIHPLKLVDPKRTTVEDTVGVRNFSGL